MKIIVDDKIPYIRETLERLFHQVVYLKGTEISARDVRDADALIVRTRTMCNEALLSSSSVRFIATATIGFDHLDTDYLEHRGITWMSCPGCNSGSVAQYVKSALLLLKREKGLNLQSSVLGIVGYGHVGKKVKTAAEQLGMRVLVNDPPLEDGGVSGCFSSLDDICEQADVITFHVPLNLQGRYSTYHLADESFFRRLRRSPYIINTSRGSVVDNTALLQALLRGYVRDAVIDTWENEPHIDRELLNRVFIGTPHVAGYSADGKVNADNMVVEGLCNFFHLPHPQPITPPDLPQPLVLSAELEERILQYYNPLIDTEKLKSHPLDFEEIRNHYPIRREME